MWARLSGSCYGAERARPMNSIRVQKEGVWLLACMMLGRLRPEPPPATEEPAMLVLPSCWEVKLARLALCSKEREGGRGGSSGADGGAALDRPGCVGVRLRHFRSSKRFLPSPATNQPITRRPR